MTLAKDIFYNFNKYVNRYTLSAAFFSCAAIGISSQGEVVAPEPLSVKTYGPPPVRIVEPLPMLAMSDEQSRIKTLSCLSMAVYGEARSESTIGQRAVAEVILNRVDSPYYPNDVCAVVYQYKQFSFVYDVNYPKTNKAFAQENPSNAVLKAIAVSRNATDRPAYERIVKGLHYHGVTATPNWAEAFQKYDSVTVDKHKFYASVRP